MFLIVSWHEKDDEKEINIQFKFDDQDIHNSLRNDRVIIYCIKTYKKYLNTLIQSYELYYLTKVIIVIYRKYCVSLVQFDCIQNDAKVIFWPPT